MSIKKTNVPSLSELYSAIGPIDSDEARTTTKPLCANIFDVQRNELVEEYERLRKAFWCELDSSNTNQQPPSSIPMLQTVSQLEETPSPPVSVRELTPLQSHLQPMAPTVTRTPSPLIPPPQSQTPPIITTNTPHKRVLSDTESATSKRQKTSLVQDHSTLKTVKLSPQKAYESLLKLKLLLIRKLKTADGYNESKVISMLTDVKRTKSAEQSRHLANYLVPVAKAMRRDTITKTLEQWFL